MKDGVSEKKQKHQAHYLSADFYLLRAPVLPAAFFLHLLGEDAWEESSEKAWSTDNEAYKLAVQRCSRKVHDLSSQPTLKYALAVASPSLIEGLQRLKPGDTSKRAKRVVSRTLRYLVRMCSRPTPFGLFAGVAIGTFAEKTTASLSKPIIDHVRTRPDMSWLYEIIRQVEQRPELVTQLVVIKNQTIQIVHGRASLPVDDTYRQPDARSISLRVTPPVRFVFDHACQPICYAELRRKLAQAFPHASTEQVDQLLWQLWEHNFLISDLRPPLTHPSPARYVLDYLQRINGAETLAAGLQSVFEDIQALDRANGQAALPLLQDLVRHQEQVVPGARFTFQIDAALHTPSLLLQQEIGRVAAQCAEILARLARPSRREAHLQQYFDAFVERYGFYQEVPLLDLLSPETGLDAPPTYQNPPRSAPLTGNPRIQEPDQYDTLLQELALLAVNERRMEVELTDDVLERLIQHQPDEQAFFPSAELYFQIEGQSKEALDQGAWRAVLSPMPGSPAAGRTFGRFCDLLPAQAGEALQRFLQDEEALYPETIFAEISYLHQSTRTANVAIRPPVRSYEIAVGVTPSVPPDHVILLEDLVVGVRNKHFYVRSRRLEKEVIACQTHMLNSRGAPNVCRFLLEVSSYRFAPFAHFDWGIAQTFPFLPRLTYQRIVLHPARWRLARTTFALSDMNSESWFNSLQQWRTAWRVPRYVYLCSLDNRLLLDLQHPSMAEELRTELEQLSPDGQLLLEELLPDFDHLWLEDEQGAKYFAEVVVPVRLARSPEQKTPPVTSSHPLPVLPQPAPYLERAFFPGTAWIYLKLYASDRQREALIADPLRDIVYALQQRGLIDCWFFIRYADPSPHIRVRFHARDEQAIQPALATVLSWGRDMAEQGQIRTFCLDTYERELERYGGPRAITFIEQVFMADSAATSALIAAVYHQQLTINPLALAVFSLDRFFTDWGFDLTRRQQWSHDYIPKTHDKTFHLQQQLLCDLIAPWKYTRNSTALMQREHLCTLIEPQRTVLAAVAAQLRELARTGELWQTEDELLRSLAHMHINRLMENGALKEPQVLGFWRRTLESICLRPERDDPL